MKKKLLPAVFLLGLICLGLVLTEAALYLKIVKLRSLEPLYQARAARDAKFKVVIIGDSYSLSYRRMLGGRLERYLRERPDTAVVNLARAGWGPIEYLDVYKRIARQIKPDLVIINAFVGSDTCSDVSYRRPRGLFLRFVDLARWTYLGTALFELSIQLRLAHMVSDLNQDLRAQGLRLPQTMNPFLLEMLHKHPEYFRLNLLMEGEGAEAAWSRSRQLFGELVTLAKESHAKVLFNIFPSPVQLSGSHVDFLKKLGYDIDRRVLGTTLPQKRFMEFCQGEKLYCNDLTRELRKHGNEKLFLDYDDHLTLRGHELAFTLIRETLERNGIVKGQ